MSLVLYTHPMSPCAQKVRIVLAEKSLAFEARHVDLPGKENLSPDYLALNPLGVVPTLVDHDVPIIESSIICEYLEDRFPTPSLRPMAPQARAEMRLWMKHVDNKLHPSCGALQWPLVMADKLRRLPVEEQMRVIEQVPEKPRRERQRRLLLQGYDAPDVAEGVQVYEQTIADLDTLLAMRPWVAGDAFSLADASLAPYFQTLFQFGWEAWYASRAQVADWYTRVRARPSYATGVAADFDADRLADLRARGAPAWDRIRKLLGG
ncbi:MAG: glutathione S-transferase family protein [Gammaproteobacteria bacterium]|jgi:glutathione S-transferase|nr:glutathione S-transferase family protein [Gammaproteobacteria bacterium]